MSDVRIPWDELAATFSTIIAKNLPQNIPGGTRHYDITHEFALGRLHEGQQVGAFFLSRGCEGRVLDVGAGNGGASLAMANYARFAVTAIDILPNTDVLELRRTIPSLPLTQLVGNGEILPFPDDTFDVVLCLDTIEHVPDGAKMGREIMRVLRPGGICMITTPPRLRYWFRRDPHYGIPGLILLPDGLQRAVGAAVLGKRGSYDVTHIYWRVNEIARLFPGSRTEVLWNHQFTGRTLFDRLWFRARHYFWDRVLLTKG